jgi:diaminopimelate epimerase
MTSMTAPIAATYPGIRLTKHHGLGNDFLVCSLEQRLPRIAWEVLARRWCDRRRGIGADGLLLLGVDAPDVPDQLRMTLFNADGSRAEMSGNGIRCLAQAAYLLQEREGPVRYLVATDAGDRTVQVAPIDHRRIEASVDMGAVETLVAPEGWAATGVHPDRPVLHLGLGNPHSVVAVDDVSAVDLAALGALVPQVNLEIVEPGPELDAVTMRVHERGAGITEACGTGACAAAWAAARWGFVDPAAPEVVVHMDGGDARVRLDQPSVGHVTLTGPAEYIGTVYVGA